MKNLLPRFLRFLALWPEILGLPMALLVFFISPLALRKTDPTAIVYDVGILQIILFALIAMLSLNSLVWLGIRLNFRTLFHYYVEQFQCDFINLKPVQRICVLLSVYFGLLIAFVLLVRVL
ncbi:hypothetical protein [Flexibacter flexilis]|uniref:hypothetical protein n=1 Tax=Flexibacter flexilis TaxID=998 RepID=UPI0011601A9A|nr:hypothetical protein [Flexibacter flexilis]